MSDRRSLHAFEVRTTARQEMVDVTSQVAALVHGREGPGMVSVVVPHTSAAVTVNENADPDVQRDMLLWLDRLVPQAPDFRHAEGNSDAHLKATLVGSSVAIPYAAGRLRLGTWQGIYFCEFDGPRTRRMEVLVD